MTGNSPTSIAELEQWFSIPRMNTYRNSENPEGFYIWNTQLSKPYLEDIQHVEVLLRNRVDAQLRSARCPFWFEDDSYFRFVQKFKKALTTAKRRTKTNDSPGKIITAQQVTFKRRK